MKKKLFSAAMLAACSTLLFSACKKDDDSSSENNSSKIIGTWKQTFDATDANNNNVLDASEKVNFTDYNVVTFSSNGTFIDTASDAGFHAKFGGTYSISGDYARSIIPGLDTSSVKIYQLDNTTLITQDTSAHPLEWTGFTKQ